jgi:hypothetical protein
MKIENITYYFHGIMAWVFSPVKNKKGTAPFTWSIFSEESVVIREPIFFLETV